jgi:hypothetical protein
METSSMPSSPHWSAQAYAQMFKSTDIRHRLLAVQISSLEHHVPDGSKG